MLLGSVQMCGEKLSTLEVNDLCESLNTHAVRILSLRKCAMSDPDFQRLAQSVGKCKAILQLNLNLGLLKNVERVRHLSAALCTNRSLTSLFVHGSPIGDKGAEILCRALSMHPRIVSLDMGDCKLTDGSVLSITDLLPPNGAKRGLEELILSANPGITPQGWAKFFVAMAASSTLRSLSLDYNNLGDGGASCLAVALAARRSVQNVDVEGCGISDIGGRVLLHLAANFPTRVTQLILDGNKLQPRTLKAVKLCLKDNETASNQGKDDNQVDEDDNETTTEISDSSSQDGGDDELADVRVSPRENHVTVAMTPRGLANRVTPPVTKTTETASSADVGLVSASKENHPNPQKSSESWIPTDSWEKSAKNTSGGGQGLRSSANEMADLVFSGSPGGSTSLHLSQAYKEVL